ncbi:MAG: hypothetical protein OXG88_05980 [Gammaproteobacteria bacterium]|nr:hypothetical protein [Gammaproteobacteria bacterium]
MSYQRKVCEEAGCRREVSQRAISMAYNSLSLPEYLKTAQVVVESDLSTWMCCKENREASKGKTLVIYRLNDKELELKKKMSAD